MSSVTSFNISRKLQQAFIETCRMKKLDVRVVLEKFISDFVSQFSESQLDIEEWTYQLNRKYLGKDILSDKERLVGDVTVKQYLRLSEPEKDKLWNKWYKEELEKNIYATARNVRKDAITTG